MARDWSVRLRSVAYLSEAVALGIGVVATGAPSRPAAGYVGDITGRWHAVSAPGTSLRLGAIVEGGDTIRADQARGPAQSIALVLRDGRVLTAKCGLPEQRATPASCTTVVVPAVGAAARSRMAVALGEVMALLRGHDPEQYASLVSRGAGGVLADGVVRLDVEQVDLTSVFAGMEPGAYRVCLTRFTIAASASTRTNAVCNAAIDYSWQPGRGSAVRIPGLTPGLFALRATIDGDSVESWVLIADSAGYRKRHDAFTQMEVASHSWRRGMPSSAIRRVLRAYLVALAPTVGSAANESRR